MKYQEFVRSTICTMEDDVFEKLKKMLLGEYISFEIIEADDITNDIFAEKICDYFEKLELETKKSFDKQVEIFIKDIDSVVGGRVAKTPKAKKDEKALVIEPRSRKYYNKALKIKDVRNLSIINLNDFTRIMMCLYTEIIKKKYQDITDFDFALDCLDAEEIIQSLKEEKDPIVKIGKKKRFNIKELYCSDTGTFIILIIMLHKILNNKIEGEC